jgi:hypothetical protein
MPRRGVPKRGRAQSVIHTRARNRNGISETAGFRPASVRFAREGQNI